MSAFDHMENETDISLIDDPDIKSLLSSTATLNIDILLLGEPALARIPWRSAFITSPADGVTSSP